MTLPKEFADLTVAQYQECDRIINDPVQDEFLVDLTAPVRLLMYLLGKTEDEVLSMDVVKEYAKLSFLNNPDELESLPAKELIVTNKTVYRADLKTPEMKTGALIALKFFESQKNPVQYLHEQLATIYLPVNLLGITRKYNASRHKKIAEDFKQAKLKDVYGFLVFKKKVFEKLKPLLELSLVESLETIATAQKEAITYLKKEGLLAS